MHTRKKIRLAVQEKLAGHPLLEKLFLARTRAARSEDLPFANIITGAEVTEDLSDQYQEQRTVQVYVQLYALNGAAVVDVLDDLADVVEQRLITDPYLGGICQSLRYKGSQPDYESAADLEAALLTMTYECVYIWQPSVEGDDLQKVAVEIDMASPRNDPPLPVGPDGQVDASATINFPQ
ncbi:hypothetical protein [Herbaspirillum rubrisubalbicans]|uniref:Uncharacterized protein n=1 Tax=Herbaspirillum rubrisubalbicans TaxID=80842 RepID=A0AAD0U8L2_9BURK|nr:hypothetical protein [Herbaspirillum rubrisubalbicans]AYR24256.1 hypothetical protein RC54_10635 [Herbaspirillum rubrisubalbicans]